MNFQAAEAAATDGGGIGDLISNPAISTPAGFALAVLVYLAKLWKDSRQERRADHDQSQTRESHIVDETKDILTTRREEAADLRKQAGEDRLLLREQVAMLRDAEDQLAFMMRANRDLHETIRQLRETLQDGTGQGIEDSGARRTHQARGAGADRTDPALPRRVDGPDVGPGPVSHRREGAG